MAHRPSGLSASLVIGACVIVILVMAAPGAGLPAANGYVPTETPPVVIYLPWIAGDFVGLPTATPTATPSPTPTQTPTPTPTLPPACALPAQIDPAIAITVSPNRNSALQEMVGKIPFTVSMAAAASGGIPPYTYCWDIEPDGHQDASGATPTFTLTRAGIFNPLLVVIDAAGHGQYIGAPPAGSAPGAGGVR